MRRLLPYLVAAALVSATAVAGPVVHFRDGRTLEVEAVSIESDLAILALEGGGQIAVPVGRVLGWRDAAPVETEDGQETDALTYEWHLVAGEYAGLIERVADEYGLDPALLTAMAEAESAFNPQAVSPKGACGLLQLMPMTAERFGVSDVFDAAENVEGGARYMSWLLRRFEGRTELALAGYNAGEGAVDRHQGVPPYRETRAYVTRVTQRAGWMAAPLAD